MKKIVSVLVACVLCLLMSGCPAKLSEEEKRMKATNEWISANVTNTDFTLFSAGNSVFWLDENNNIRAWNSYTFMMLASDDILYDSVSVDFRSDVEFVLGNIVRSTAVLQKGKVLDIEVSYPKNLCIELAECTLTYTTSNDEEVSKDYVLDFTQEPFRTYWDNY